jgi:hypothetical protein
MCFNSLQVIFQVLTAANKMTTFWNIASYSLVLVGRCFRVAYCSHHQGGNGQVVSTLKRRSTSTRLYGAVSQNAVILC